MSNHNFFKELLIEAEKKNLPKTMVDHIKHLQSVGGKIIGEITKDHEIGYIGINGTGKTAVKFAFYPDHTYDRLEKGTKIRQGWSGITITDLDMIAKDQAKAARLARAEKKELKFVENIRVSEEEFIKICKASGISIGKIADMWVDRDGYDYVNVSGEDREVATAVYSVTTINEDADEDEEEFHDPFYITLTRDAKNPNKITATD